jgi:CRISPR/Cas system-associated endonuclease Cas1
MKVFKNLLSDAQGIPTDFENNIFNYDYGVEINEKLRALKWTPKQYDAFLDYLHQERDIASLVRDFLYYAPSETLVQDADALGIFDNEEDV